MLSSAVSTKPNNNISPAKKIRSLQRLICFLKKKISDNSSLAICPQKIQSSSPSDSNLTTFILQTISIPPKPFNEHEEIVTSDLQPYCPECDHLFKREQVLYFREHCRVMHNWLWCENWYRGEGCEVAEESQEELDKHMETCHFKTNQPAT